MPQGLVVRWLVTLLVVPLVPLLVLPLVPLLVLLTELATRSGFVSERG
jgi:hypothetical protein